MSGLRRMDDETRIYLRKCFNTPEGKRTLGWLLANSGYFDDNTKTTEQVAVVNFAKKILKEMGIYSLENISSYVEGIMNIPVKPEKGKEDESV